MFRRETIALLALTVMFAAVMPAGAQFGTGTYGSLVWDPDKQCWVRISREGFPSRLVDDRVLHVGGEQGRGGVLIADGMPYVLVGDAPPAGMIIINGTPSTNPAGDYRQTIDQGNVPTIGPDGRPLSPAAREFVRDAMTASGYGDVTGGEYGNVGEVGGDFWKEDTSGVAASIHINGYGTFFMTNAGNVLHNPGLNGRADYTSTTVWTGIGNSTSYPLFSNDGQPGSLNDVTYNIDPTTAQCTSIEFHFNGGDPFVLSPNSGTTLYIDPFPPGIPPGGPVPPVTLLQYNPGQGGGAWVEPRKKEPPKAKKEDPPPAANVPLEELEGVVLGIDYEPDFGFGASWHRRLLNERDFDYEPVDREADNGLLIQPGIQVSFLGPPPLTNEERARIDGVANEVTALGDEIEERRRAGAEQRQLIAGQQQIFDIFHERTVTGVDEAREKAKQVVVGQIEAGIGVLLSNSDKIKDAFNRMPDGPAKDQLGRVFNNDTWTDLVEGGADSVASGAFDSYKFAKDLYTGGIGEAALNFLPDNVQLAIGQVRAAHKLSQAVSGLIEGTWNAGELDDMGASLEISQRQYHIHMQGTRDLILQQQELAGRVVELTENAVRGVDGLDRVRFINGVIQELEHNSGGVDVTDQLNELRTLRDDTIIYLPGGEWGVEPVLYHRLSLVPNASARMRMLFEQNMAAKFGPDWDASSRRPQDVLVQLPPFSQGSGTKVEPGKTGGTPKPKPPTDQPPQNVPVTLPDGTTGTTPGPGTGPITMSDGTRIYTYTGGSVERVFQLPGGATVIHHRNGNVEVVAPDGTRTVTMPDGVTLVTLPDGTIVTKKPGGLTVTESDDGRVIFTDGEGGDALFVPSPFQGDIDIILSENDFDGDGKAAMPVFRPSQPMFQMIVQNCDTELSSDATTITYYGLE
jgi:hypothetical protein